jgi:hypothetical protein
VTRNGGFHRTSSSIALRRARDLCCRTFCCLCACSAFLVSCDTFASQALSRILAWMAAAPLNAERLLAASERCRTVRLSSPTGVGLWSPKRLNTARSVGPSRLAWRAAASGSPTPGRRVRRCVRLLLIQPAIPPRPSVAENWVGRIRRDLTPGSLAALGTNRWHARASSRSRASARLLGHSHEVRHLSGELRHVGDRGKREQQRRKPRQDCKRRALH